METRLTPAQRATIRAFFHAEYQITSQLHGGLLFGWFVLLLIGVGAILLGLSNGAAGWINGQFVQLKVDARIPVEHPNFPAIRWGVVAAGGLLLAILLRWVVVRLLTLLEEWRRHVGVEGERPTDDNMDRWYKQDREAVVELGLRLANIRREDLVGERIIVIPVPVRKAGTYWRPGKDKVVRHSHERVTVLYFTEHQLISFGCVVNHLEGRTHSEMVSEYFYRFVLGVTLATESVELDAYGRQLSFNHARVLQLALNGAAPVSLALGDLQLANSLDEDPPSRTEIEHALNGIRRMVRERQACA